jgi:hypothetical protein
LNLRELIELTPEAFEDRFYGSPLWKAGLEALKGNAAICLKKPL